MNSTVQVNRDSSPELDIVCEEKGAYWTYTTCYALGTRQVIGEVNVIISPDESITRAVALSENLKSLKRNAPEESVAEITVFYPHGSGSDAEARKDFQGNGPRPFGRGIGTRVLNRIIEDALTKGAKGVFCKTSQDGMIGLLNSRGFQAVSVGDYGKGRIVDFYLPLS
jgi:hypothetical protein